MKKTMSVFTVDLCAGTLDKGIRKVDTTPPEILFDLLDTAFDFARLWLLEFQTQSTTINNKQKDHTRSVQKAKGKQKEEEKGTWSVSSIRRRKEPLDRLAKRKLKRAVRRPPR